MNSNLIFNPVVRTIKTGRAVSTASVCHVKTCNFAYSRLQRGRSDRSNGLKLCFQRLSFTPKLPESNSDSLSNCLLNFLTDLIVFVYKCLIFSLALSNHSLLRSNLQTISHQLIVRQKHTCSTMADTTKVLGPGEDFKIVVLNMLSFRDIPRCDLTGARAKVQLITHFNQIYYATDEMAEQAWFGIVKKIDHLLAPLMQPAPIVGTSEERAKRAEATKDSKRSLIEFCLTESSNLLSIQKFKLAVPASIQALKFSTDCDGDRSLAVVEPYLQLAQAYLGLEEYGKAEEFLSLARWIVLNTAECSDRIRSRMYVIRIDMLDV